MPERVKYPLTPEAKDAAKALVEAWDEDRIEQTLYVAIARGDDTETLFLMNGDIKLPTKGILYELSTYNLIQIISRDNASFELLLLQELRNAVESDFEVSDYFLTLNAVGTIIYGNLEVREGGIFQSAAAGMGNIIQNTGQLADQLEDLLGDEVLAEHEDLNHAIQDLRSADENNLRQRLGKVIMELGRVLDRLANFRDVILSIYLIARFFGA